MTLRNDQYMQILTYGAIELTNQSIWKRNGLKLKGMDPFVSIVNSSLVYNRSRNGANSSIDETKAVVKGCSSVVDCNCVRTQGSNVHNCVIPLSNSVPIIW